MPNRCVQKFESSDVATNPADSVVATTDSDTLAAANDGRVALYVTNDGANAVYLALGDTAVKNTGIRLNKEGGAVVIDDYTGVVSAITAEGESVVTFSEV